MEGAHEKCPCISTQKANVKALDLVQIQGMKEQVGTGEMLRNQRRKCFTFLAFDYILTHNYHGRSHGNMSTIQWSRRANALSSLSLFVERVTKISLCLL